MSCTASFTSVLDDDDAGAFAALRQCEVAAEAVFAGRDVDPLGRHAHVALLFIGVCSDDGVAANRGSQCATRIVCAAAHGCSRKRIVIISIIHFSGALGSLAVASFGAGCIRSEVAAVRALTAPTRSPRKAPRRAGIAARSSARSSMR
jgi:hypothetical protein